MPPLTDVQREKGYWAATYLLAAIPLLGWWMYGLFDLDEGFYAAITAEMLRTGDWITPHFNGSPWFEKPILLYWAAAPFAALFGEAGLRMPSVLANMALYAMVGAFVARRVSPAAGRWTVLVLATSPLVAVLGKMMMTDALFALCMTGSLLALYRSFSEGVLWRTLSGAALGLAVLAKGPVAIVLAVLVTAVVFLRQSGLRRNLIAPAPWAGWLAALAAVVAAWYLPAYLANGDVFVQRFLIDQNLGRFSGGDKAHAIPWSQWYVHIAFFPLALGLGMLPWSWRIVGGWPRRAEAEEPGAAFFQFCAHWFLVVLVFFSIAGSKLPHYILPAAVPMGILCARTLRTPLFGIGTLVWTGVLAGLLTFAGMTYYEQSGQKEAHRLARWLRGKPGQVAAYQLPRRQKDLGTGRPKLQETSLPSLAFYLNATFVQAESFDEVSGSAGPVWVFTRSGRVRPADVAQLQARGWRVAQPRPFGGGGHFEVYRLEKRSP
jgi:4-amino-4-deoxy-L-arabinose transferase-like glycosyltransferase